MAGENIGNEQLNGLLREYELIFNHIQDVVFFIGVDEDKNFRYLMGNEQFRSLLNTSSEELRGKTPHELVDKETADFFVANYEKCCQLKRDMEYEETLELPAGRSTYLTALSPILENGIVTKIVGSSRNLTERKEVEEVYRESEEKFRTLAESSPAAIMIYQNDRWVYVNPAAEQITGYSKNELYNMKFWEFVHPDFQEITYERGRQRQRGINITPHYELKLITKEGREKWVALTGATTHYEGAPAGLLTAIDITERKEAEEALRESEERYRDILDTMEEGYYEVDLGGNIVFCNKSAAKLMGYELEEMYGINFRKICNDPDTVYKQFNRVFKSGEPEYALTLEMVRKDGSTGYGEFSVTPVKNKSGQITGFRGIVRDITERHQYEEQLKYISFHDQLTDLYNRAYFENEMERLEASREYPITIVSVDLDGLKLVNDTMGHRQGDELLVQCARILQGVFRASDIVARVGGDEFAVILPRTDKETGDKIVNRIHEAIESHNSQEANESLPLSVSIGLATAEYEERSLEETFREADNLMYRDKLRKGVATRSHIVHALVAALGEKDFVAEGHVQRLEELCLKVAKKLNLSNQQLSNLALLVRVHDIGKVGIPDRILYKQGPLNDEEWEIMRQHTEKGYRIALSSMDLAEVADLVLKHHERWRGNGYPMGLKEEEIPIECRILAVADAYDAMTNDRPYRKAMSKEEAIAELKRCAGTHFDPYIVDIFLSVLDEIEKNSADSSNNASSNNAD